MKKHLLSSAILHAILILGICLALWKTYDYVERQEQAFVEDQLWSLLSQRYAQAPAGEKPLLVVRGDKDCPYEKIVLIMDIAQELNIDRISWAVNREL